MTKRYTEADLQELLAVGIAQANAERDQLRDALADAVADYDAWAQDADVKPTESVLAWVAKAKAALGCAQ